MSSKFKRDGWGSAKKNMSMEMRAKEYIDTLSSKGASKGKIMMYLMPLVLKRKIRALLRRDVMEFQVCK